MIVFQNERGKVKHTEVKEEEWVYRTDLGGHVISLFTVFTCKNRLRSRIPLSKVRKL